MARLSRSAVVVVALVFAAGAGAGPRGRGFVLAGEIVRFDDALVPVFTVRQLEETAEATRQGFLRWAATEEGKSIIRRMRGADREVIVVEIETEPGVGRAPEPGFLALLTAEDPSKLKSYDLILNPRTAAGYRTNSPLDLGLPRSPSDAMALAWAAEMLHIDFYSRGIALPHHRRKDFQERWARVAAQLGFPQVFHGTGEH